jgi:hypothetical protein
MLHGVTVEKLCTIAMSGFASAAASNPAAWSMALAGARDGPSTISRDGNLLELISGTCSILDTIALLKHDRRSKKRDDNGWSCQFALATYAAMQHK